MDEKQRGFLSLVDFFFKSNKLPNKSGHQFIKSSSVKRKLQNFPFQPEIYIGSGRTAVETFIHMINVETNFVVTIYADLSQNLFCCHLRCIFAK